MESAEDTSSPDLDRNGSCWATAKVDRTAEKRKDIRIIFGYGSIMWRPALDYVDCFPAKAKGFVRRFWQSSVDHRGTVAYPGRVATLLRCKDLPEVSGVAHPEEGVWGMAYVLKEDGLEKTMEMLDIREKNGYTRTVTTLYDANDNSIGECFLYYGSVNTSENPMFTGAETIESIARRVRSAVGPSGANADYVYRLWRCLQSLGVRDDHVNALYDAIKAA
ncbi:Cation transport protein chaC, putative [Perkinsus marinus ATCC 50983]|uniref:glutathione-specific gamma-glutamylcyclotransferase n=1 Tax=Perkinsus marinus (strain ATCC 50983 / TXsc) TaxID=423536 RepID=C5K8H0_PERM5|nr:Cation transport protein chaC, putative [Perkinsus marinus ATCC 50983]EER19177.1 Cation transport protein chaC, putative [Perkinsus marinus ATCC 50983]|eukprot:XP_002787381.1 Cation transport protein chaC, putative [Perkinsus marinus ATCC 50983]